MAETTYDKNEIPLINPSTGRRQSGGIICPWNRDATGPAKQKIHCMVWADWNDFNTNAKENNFRFCRQLCQYGHNPEYTRRERQAHRAFKARKWQRRRYRQRLEATKEWWQRPVIGRKIA